MGQSVSRSDEDKACMVGEERNIPGEARAEAENDNLEPYEPAAEHVDELGDGELEVPGEPLTTRMGKPLASEGDCMCHRGASREENHQLSASTAQYGRSASVGPSQQQGHSTHSAANIPPKKAAMKTPSWLLRCSQEWPFKTVRFSKPFDENDRGWNKGRGVAKASVRSARTVRASPSRTNSTHQRLGQAALRARACRLRTSRVCRERG